MLAGSRNLAQEDSFVINISASSLIEGSHDRDGVWISDLNWHRFFTILFPHFLLSLSFDGEDISNTQIQTPQRWSKLFSLRVVFLNSLLRVWKCGRT